MPQEKIAQVTIRDLARNAINEWDGSLVNTASRIFEGNIHLPAILMFGV